MANRLPRGTRKTSVVHVVRTFLCRPCWLEYLEISFGGRGERSQVGGDLRYPGPGGSCRFQPLSRELLGGFVTGC